MPEQQKISSVLIGHFFRRFFDSDTVQVEGETLTTVIRAASAVAAPGLTVAFFLQNQYPGRSLWGSIEDQYAFVVFSFVAMGAAAIFEWEMLFPDRLDFLILSPLPVKPLQMLGAKLAALIVFLSLFLFSSNVFGALVLPLISQRNLFRHFFAHSVAVLLAGLFASLFFLAVAGVLLCVLGAGRFRALSPLIQMFSVTALLLLMMHYVKVGNNIQSLLSAPPGATRWVPSLWFLGMYETLLHGNAAPAFARPMAEYGYPRAPYSNRRCADYLPDGMGADAPHGDRRRVRTASPFVTVAAACDAFLCAPAGGARGFPLYRADHHP